MMTLIAIVLWWMALNGVVNVIGRLWTRSGGSIALGAFWVAANGLLGYATLAWDSLVWRLLAVVDLGLMAFIFFYIFVTVLRHGEGSRKRLNEEEQGGEWLKLCYFYLHGLLLAACTIALFFS